MIIYVITHKIYLATASILYLEIKPTDQEIEYGHGAQKGESSSFKPHPQYQGMRLYHGSVSQASPSPTRRKGLARETRYGCGKVFGIRVGIYITQTPVLSCSKCFIIVMCLRVYNL